MLDLRLQPLISNKPFPCVQTAALIGLFQLLPPEIILEICAMLTSTHIFSLKTAPPAAYNWGLPDLFYLRFLQDKLKYLLTLIKEVADYEALRERKELNAIDSQGSFECLQNLMIVPKDGEE